MNNSSLSNLVIPIRRFTQNPIITPDMLEGIDGRHINGPSLIFAPEWLPRRLGRFYLYFAHHKGRSIRLAYADNLEGPWTIYQPGTLQLADATGCRDHIASPDVHVDHTNKRIRMFFHGVEAGGTKQSSFLATSSDGIHFEAGTTPIGKFYLRMVQWRGAWIGMAKGGVMYLSDSGVTDFRQLPQPAFPMRHPAANAAGDIRHVALHVTGDVLQVYFTRIGDMPERIFRANIDLSEPPENWRAGKTEPVLSPVMQWEGADMPPSHSQPGAATGRENAVRDPAIFVHDNHTYLLYSVAGESGIAIAEIMPAGQMTHTPKDGDQPRPLKSGELLTIKLANPNNLAPDLLHRNELKRLSHAGYLNAQLAAMDRIKPLKRIYLMGCGRSGTWLLTAVMSTFQDICIAPKELSFENFGIFSTTSSTLLLKRNYNAFERIEQIPAQVRIAYMVRHPYDVLTSYNPTVQMQHYHIQPHRWLGEMLALQFLLDSQRPNVKIIRYEDLVMNPDAVQAELASYFDLDIGAAVQDITDTFNPSRAAAEAMHGLRKIDMNSIGRYKKDNRHIEYLRAIRPRLGRTLDWVAEQFSYDVSL